MKALQRKGSFATLQDPPRQYALPHLSADCLAQLRRVDKAAQLLVDQHTGSTWKAAAYALVDPGSLLSADHRHAVQAKLREQMLCYRLS